MPLPDAEAQCRQLAELIRPNLTPQTALVGIHTGGAWIAQRLHDDLFPGQPGPGFLSSAFHRDDYGERGLPRAMARTELPFEIAGADIILVDDILYTGRTVRAAINELYDYGRPARVRLAVLLDRGGRQLPFAPDYCGALHPLDADSAFVLSQDTAGRLSLRVERDDAQPAAQQ